MYFNLTDDSHPVLQKWIFSGVGKSETIKAAAIHAENILRVEGTNPNHPNVIVAAFTGKAASLIGMTIQNFL